LSAERDVRSAERGVLGQWQAATRGEGSTPTQTYLRTGGP